MSVSEQTFSSLEMLPPAVPGSSEPMRPRIPTRRSLKYLKSFVEQQEFGGGAVCVNARCRDGGKTRAAENGFTEPDAELHHTYSQQKLCNATHSSALFYQKFFLSLQKYLYRNIEK